MSIFLTKIARVKASRVLKAHLGTMAQKSAYAKVLGSCKKFLGTLSIGFAPPGWFNACLKKQALQKTSWIISSFKRFIQAVSTQGWASKASREKPLLKKGSFGSPLISFLDPIRHGLSSVRSVLWVGIICFSILWVLCFVAETSYFDRHLGFRCLHAFRDVMIGDSWAPHLLFNPEKLMEVSALDFIYHPLIMESVKACITGLAWGGLKALSLTLLFLALLGIYVYRSRQWQSLSDSIAQIPRPGNGAHALEPSDETCACKRASLAPVESLEAHPLSDTDIVEQHLDQIPMHSQRAVRSERKEPCVCSEDPDLSYPACAVSSELCQVGEKAAVFKAIEASVMTLEKEDRA